MGSGKSYLGRKLALQMGIHFLDLDDYIVKKAGQSIPEIFETKGESTFRMIESIALKETFNLEKVIIATGGGTPCHQNNIDKMRKNGLVVFIDPTVDILKKRLRTEIETRPLLQKQTNLRNYILGKLADRLPIYKQAHLIYKIEDEFTDAADLGDYLKGYLKRRKVD